MEPTIRTSSRPEQQKLAFNGDERQRAEEAQPELTSEPNACPAEPLNGFPTGVPTQKDQSPGVSTPLWLQRVWLVIFVVFCLELGIVMVWLPWTQVWTNNAFVANLPRLRAVLHSSFVRGLVSGLGLIDIWIGIWEAVHYQEKR